ncbi:MAG: cobalamin biosynthesis protein CobD [Dehalococcoidia bacterium]|nr:cobalamin biosynthesis protein CobD [Dehalococcoidia bacterium]MBF8304379.1 cobalamin biosynthesis protein CobD [Dehalococcoidia bacterium]
MLTIAIILDWIMGEPPNKLHPVAWLGKLISLEERVAPQTGKVAQFICGVGIVILDVLLFALPVYWFLNYAWTVSPVVYMIAGGVLLKISFSLRFLVQSAMKIKSLLEVDKIDDARLNLRSLVSRDTSSLDKPHMVSAAIESVAENVTDSFIAPLFYFLIMGVPGAIAYRVVNTLDAMIGYHGQYEYLGKAAARLDDALNYIPARLTALLIVASAFLTGRKNGVNAWRILYRDNGQTESPNAGWPMSAMAGAMNVQLEKEGFYKLGGGQRQPIPLDIKGSVYLTLITAGIWFIICLAIAGVRHAYFP